MSAIPRSVREQIEALREAARVQMLGADPPGDRLVRPMAAAAYHAHGKVLAILDAADREHEDARRAHFERDDVP